MTNEEILKKAIEKAVRNGYEYWDYTSIDKISFNQMADGDMVNLVTGDGQNWDIGLYNIIFSHSFAKALNFKLKDLGAWCDEGKEPLKFIEKLI